ncbi:MAG: cofactor-independent phosphoglycerate mutase [Verrucomicrobiae bacterium]|nr:cofactor-independent phosphoglycerate mutase [Verrucomicrobiae bacterium]
MDTHHYKYAVLVGDGMADRPLPQLGGHTPLEAARTPNMDAVAREGAAGLVATIPEGLPPGSDVGNLSLFGYDPRQYYQGRAPIEAASMGVALAPGETAFRCNFVTVSGGRMEDYSAGHLDNAEAAALVAELQTVLRPPLCRLHLGVDYRHLMIFSGLNTSDLATTPPHDITGQPITGFLPSGTSGAQVRAVMEKALPALAQSKVNRARAAAGKPAVTHIWLWGQGNAVTLPSLSQKHGLSGTVISAVNLVKGLGVLAGLEAAQVKGATGYLDTNYAGKMAAAAGALASKDFVYVHVEAPDETSHEGSVEKKVKAIEDFDCRIVGEFLKLRDRIPNLRILVVSDHATPISLRTHSAEPVPFAMSGPGIKTDAADAYTEKAVEGRPPLSGPALLEKFLSSDHNR